MKADILDLDDIVLYRWLKLFNQTLEELFEGPIADIAKKRAANIAIIMMVVKETSINN